MGAVDLMFLGWQRTISFSWKEHGQITKYHFIGFYIDSRWTMGCIWYITTMCYNLPYDIDPGPQCCMHGDIVRGTFSGECIISGSFQTMKILTHRIITYRMRALSRDRGPI